MAYFDNKIINLIMCPYYQYDLTQNDDELFCTQCDYTTKRFGGYHSLITPVDQRKYAWLKDVNLEDRPEYHKPGDRVRPKATYAAHGYLRPYNNKFLTLPQKYQKLVTIVNLTILRSFFIDQMRRILAKTEIKQ